MLKNNTKILILSLMAITLYCCKTIPKTVHEEYISNTSPTIQNLFKASFRIQYTPAVANKMAYFNNMHGNIYGYNLEKDTLVWKHSSRMQYSFREGVIWGNGSVIVPEESKIMGLHPLTGKKLWSLKIPFSGYRHYLIKDTSLFINDEKGTLYSYNTITGKEKWKIDLRAPLVTKPSMIESVLYVTNRHNIICAIDPKSGKIIWKSEGFFSQAVTPVIADSTKVYIALSQKHEVPENVFNYYNYIIALEKSSGKKIIEHQVDERFIKKLVKDEHNIFYPSTEGYVKAFQLNSKKASWTFKAGKIVSPLYIKNDKIIFADKENIYALNKSTGEILWKYSDLNPIRNKGMKFSGNLLLINKNGKTIETLDISTGKKVWDFNFPESLSSLSEPVIIGKKIVMVFNDKLVCVE